MTVEMPIERSKKGKQMTVLHSKTLSTMPAKINESFEDHNESGNLNVKGTW